MRVPVFLLMRLKEMAGGEQGGVILVDLAHNER